MGSGPSGPGLVTVTVSGVTFSMRGGQYHGMIIETVALHEVLLGGTVIWGTAGQDPGCLAGVDLGRSSPGLRSLRPPEMLSSRPSEFKD